MRHEEETGSGTQERRGKGRKKGRREAQARGREEEQEERKRGPRALAQASTAEREREREEERWHPSFCCVAACSPAYNKPENRKEESVCVCVSECCNQALDVAARNLTFCPTAPAGLKPRSARAKIQIQKAPNRKSKTGRRFGSSLCAYSRQLPDIPIFGHSSFVGLSMSAFPRVFVSPLLPQQVVHLRKEIFLGRTGRDEVAEIGHVAKRPLLKLQFLLHSFGEEWLEELH